MAFEDIIGIMFLGAAFLFYRVTSDLETNVMYNTVLRLLGSGTAIWLAVLGLGYALNVAQINTSAGSPYINLTETGFMIVLAPAILISVWFTIMLLVVIFTYLKEAVKNSKMSKSKVRAMESRGQ